MATAMEKMAVFAAFLLWTFTHQNLYGLVCLVKGIGDNSSCFFVNVWKNGIVHINCLILAGNHNPVITTRTVKNLNQLPYYNQASFCVEEVYFEGLVHQET